jgi:hypothetical protein
MHGGYGATLKVTTVLAMLHWLGNRPSYSRPRVSDDNACAESQQTAAVGASRIVAVSIIDCNFDEGGSRIRINHGPESTKGGGGLALRNLTSKVHSPTVWYDNTILIRLIKMEIDSTSELVISVVFLVVVIKAIGSELGKTIFRWLFKPVTLLGEFVYRWVAPRNPLNVSLWRYSRSLRRSSLSRLENPVGPPINVDVMQAFAPLKLVSGAGEEVELFEFAARTNCWIVLGGPGTGKTTLMKSLIMHMLYNQLHRDLKGVIPIFVQLRRMSSKNHKVIDAIEDAFQHSGFPNASKFISSALSQGKC